MLAPTPDHVHVKSPDRLDPTRDVDEAHLVHFDVSIDNCISASRYVVWKGEFEIHPNLAQQL